MRLKTKYSSVHTFLVGNRSYLRSKLEELRLCLDKIGIFRSRKRIFIVLREVKRRSFCCITVRNFSWLLVWLWFRWKLRLALRLCGLSHLHRFHHLKVRFFFKRRLLVIICICKIIIVFVQKYVIFILWHLLHFYNWFCYHQKVKVFVISFWIFLNNKCYPLI